MQKKFFQPLLVTTALLLALGMFSCQSERVIPIERFEKTIEGTWEIGPVVLKSESVHEFVTKFEFDELGLFDASNNNETLWSGPFLVSVPNDNSNNQYLILYTGAKTSKSYLIKEFNRNSLGLVPAEEIGTGNVYYYERK